MKTRVQKAFFIGFILLLFSLIFIFSSFFKSADTAAHDWKQVLSLNHTLLANKRFLVSDDIVILSIDDLTSFELSKYPELGIKRWPLSRGDWAQIINFLQKASPKVIAINIPFQNYEDITLSANSSDLILANTFKKYNNIVLGNVLSLPYSESIDSSTNYIDKLDNPFNPIKKSLDVGFDNQKIENNITFYSYLPVPDIFVNNVSMGFINLQRDKDSIIRHTRPISRILTGNKTDYMPSIPFAVFLKYINYDGPLKVVDSRIRINNYSIPVNSLGENYINWNGLSRSYTFIPLSKIIIGMKRDGKTFMFDKKIYPVEYFKDKIVIISPTQTNVDTHRTPIDSGISAAEVYANAIDNYINDARLDNPIRRKFLQQMPLYFAIPIVIAFCALIIVNAFIFRVSALSLINAFLLIILYLFFDVFIFINHRIRYDLSLVYPIYFMAITLISSYLYVFFNETCKKKEIINIFGKFVSKEVLNKLIKNMKNFELKTEKKKITVLRCDIANFNELSKIYELDEIIDKLNATFKIITEKIFKYNGTIDKCISDSIVAHWGDPIANANDSMSAVKAAVEIIEAVDDYNISCEGEEIKFDIKVAVNTGDAIVGPIGADKLNEYTILGDTVNIAQRIGQICLQLDNRFMISESTYNEVQNIINADYSGVIKIKGREESVKVYAPKLEQKND